MMKCDFCGYVFELSECTKKCQGCPIGGLCGKAHCPKCGYTVYLDPEIKLSFNAVKDIMRRFKKLWQK